MNSQEPSDRWKSLIVDMDGMPDEVARTLNASGLHTAAEFKDRFGPHLDPGALAGEFGLQRAQVVRAHRAFFAAMIRGPGRLK